MPPAQPPQEVELTAPTTRLPTTTRMLGPPERTYHSTDDARRAARGTHKIPVHRTIAPEDLDVDRSGQAPANQRRPRRSLPRYEPDDILSAGEKRFWRSLQQLQGTRERDLLKNSLDPINVEGVRRDGANATWCKHIDARKEDARKATAANGHDGFAAIAAQMVTPNGWALRERVWDFLDIQQGRVSRDTRQHNIITADERDAARCRMFPHGVMPSFLEGRKMMRSKLPIEFWLSSLDFWLVAEYLKRPICVDFGSTKVNNLAFTFLPIARGSPRPPQAIGLVWGRAGWTSFEVPRDAPLPPISIGGWGSKVNIIVSSEEHRYWHRSYRFMDGGGRTWRSCTCLRKPPKGRMVLLV